MDEIAVLFLILFWLSLLLVVLGLFGLGLWVSLRWLVRRLVRWSDKESRPRPDRTLRCSRCGLPLPANQKPCSHCGAARPSVSEVLNDLAASARQIERFYQFGSIDHDTFVKLKREIDSERARLSPAQATPASPAQTDVSAAPASPSQPASVTDVTALPAEAFRPADAQAIVSASLMTTEDAIVSEPEPVPTHAWAEEESAPESQTALAARMAEPEKTGGPRRKPFAEMLAAFMEQSNIRWGEIIGGLLIIGCSTALVVSLWAQISRIPVLKFLIFTSVTAALFGVGLYTEHRWKLPTTSRGILTIATLLVPLNFLAIAAVSGGTIPPGSLIIGSELIAPALFLCLVYYAGRVLTPKWPHLLAAGVLGSSVGQLLIRHFAAPDDSPLLLVALGAFPLACYLTATAWKLRIALADDEIDETETNAIFITLGALTFAALLPFGLLLYKSGPVSMTMMYLAPLVTLSGVPLLASGMFLWRCVRAKELAGSRTVGTSIALVGTLVVLSGMLLAWPNPAGIVPAALMNFGVFTLLAVFLETPPAHLFAAGCLTLAYLVLFHVGMGHIAWQNLRVTSLIEVMDSLSTGQALAPMFVLLLAGSEWLTRRRRRHDGTWYAIAGGAIAGLSLLVVVRFGIEEFSDPHALWLIYLLYAAGGLWIAWRRQKKVFAGIGSGLLLMSLAQITTKWLAIDFAWAAALLAHASLCTILAITFVRYESSRQVLSWPLNLAGLVTSFGAVALLLFNAQWEPSALLAQDLFWLAGIWLGLLWLNRRKELFAALQVALTLGVIVAVKAALQQYDWYTFHGSLHPWSLQIQGVGLVLLSLVWIAIRLMVERSPQPTATESANDQGKSTEPDNWLSAARRLLNARFASDRIVLWSVLVAFALFTLYGSLSGVRQELSPQGSPTPVWNIAGFPHQYALGPGSWILLGLLVVALLANLWERRRPVYLLAVIGVLANSCWLVAGRFEDQTATASAWRWSAALFLLLISVMLWFRERISARLTALGWPDLLGLNEFADRARILLLFLTVGPLLVLTAYPALRAIYYRPVHGPSGGLFYLLGDTLSYSLPLVIVAFSLIVYAVRERLVAYASWAGLLFNATATMVYLLSMAAVHGSMDRVVTAHVIELNGIASALYALVWLSNHGRWQDALVGEAKALAEKLLELQVGIAIVANVLLIGPVAINLVLHPAWASIGTAEAGGLFGWFAFLLTSLATISFARTYHRPLKPIFLCGFLFGASCLAAFTVTRFAPQSDSGFQALLIAVCVVAWLMALAVKLPEVFQRPEKQPLNGAMAGRMPALPDYSPNWRREAVNCSTAVGVIAIGLAFMALRPPTETIWPVGALFAMSGLAAVLQWQTLKRFYLYAAGLLFTTAALTWWAREFAGPNPDLTRVLQLINVALCSSGIIWLWLELRARKLSGSNRGTALSFHDLAALWSLVVMAVIVSFNLISGALGGSLRAQSGWWGWLALGSVAALMFACLWDRAAIYAVAGIYLLGLIGAGMLLDHFDLPAGRLGWTVVMVLAVYAIATSLVWRRRERVIVAGERLRIPRRIEPGQDRLNWLVVFNVFAVAVVVTLTCWITLRFVDLELRLTAALAVMAQGLTFSLLMPRTQRKRWQKAAFAVSALGAVFLGWAWLTPEVTGTWLDRAVILMIESFAIVALFGLELDKALEREPEWTRSIRETIPWLTSFGILALGFVFSSEISSQVRFASVSVSWVAVITVAITLLAGVVCCVFFALSPTHDPLNLPEKRRMIYVYAAEGMLALLFLHLRLTMPWLFTGFFERYWPLVVVAIAYLGVTVSEVLRRREIMVLAQPIERTGAFLPLLPALGFWITQSQVDYSLLLFFVGGLYGVLAILRRSFLFGVMAALAANGGLWHIWQRTADYTFIQHPQLWLIPAACSVLLAAYLNRDDFTEQQLVSIRYLALVTIYVSSTADIFINGVARSPWLPMILAALSVTGVLCGIMFRIRAFLVLGSIFLLLAITTMIYYASENFGWTWLWYVAGIVTGMTIIATFALFEKKRSEVLQVVEGFKEWRP